MIPASPSQDVFLAGWTFAVCLLAGAIVACLWFCPTAAHSEHAPSFPASEGWTRATRGVRLTQVNPDKTDTATDIDIIAVHGLDTRSPDTWTWRRPKTPGARLKRAENTEDCVNWLQDQRMLPAAVGRARIFTCDWPADLLQPSALVQKRIDEYALLLLDGIQRRPPATNDARGEDRPLFFVASCLGGIVLVKALVDADNENSTYRRLRRATRGIVFLATPFRGTSFQDVAAWAEPGLKAWAGVRGRRPSRLLDSVKGSALDLEVLVRRFTHLCRDEDYPCDVFTFYELGITSLPSKVFPWLPARLRREKPLVDSSSASLDIVRDPLPLDRPHVLTNKFEHSKCPDYEKVAGKIKEMLHRIREGSPLKQADAWIRDKHYTPDRLAIERLSGDLLPIDRCYINLAIVEQHRETTHRLEKDSEEEDVAPKSSPFSLQARLRAETPDRTAQVELPAIFNPRRRGNTEVNPRRILIRGRAGVGKTTLCKRIVHDFTRHGAWASLFDRVLWVPLRRLKRPSATGYKLKNLLSHEYFWNWPGNSGRLADALVRAIQDGRTLFILDGLDEASDLLDPDHRMSDFLKWLLDQRNVVITSRPYTKLPTTITVDLELETTGFYPNQVNEYLRYTFPDSQKTSKIRSFLQDHQLMQGLVRIPVQLDALCFTWNEGFDSATNLDTMTAVYRAIELRLWKKDVPQLEKENNAKSVTRLDIESASRFKMEALAEHEISFLEGLSFTGLHNDVVEFDRGFLSEAFDRFAPCLLPDTTLPRLSFLRTSDPSSEIGNQSCHFLHLSYQEYFAARYFVRQWKASPPKNLVLASQNTQDAGPMPVEYLRKHKYTARYDILWRFVTGLLDAEGKAKEFFDKELIRSILTILGRHSILSDEVLTQVAARLDDSDWHVRGAAVEALAARDQLSDEVLTQVAARLDDSNVYVRGAAVEALAARGQLSDEVLTQVAARLDDSEWLVQQATVKAFRGR
ncbi:nacht nucleoside triphosphatase [Emericellopsis cladophorae]|uniref:Protein SERAC1 n=1 Tax=Emericellopsis cladophorae TaxID=2686198 RepID=A0A9P9XTR5_9HYPO|nr:nacht nucleoside triphosphatase [Emericellopsis cladophorae]KAI6777684.1 nacht nucleoside triphosphatase [Emericellopsis cladophorae]